MRPYLARLAATFLGGAAVLIAFNVVMDPYGMRGGPRPALGQDRIALRTDYRLAKLARFRRHPTPRIILGDSRSAALDDSLFAAHGGEWSNLAFGGGTAFEAVDAFWYATRRADLRVVVLGLPFNLWSERSDMNLVPPAEALLDNPLAYYANLGVLRVGMKAVAGRLLGRRYDTEAPPMDRATFWRFQLDEGTRGQYLSWRQPDALRRRVQEVAAYCRAHGIRLYLFVPPTHVDLQRRVEAFGLAAAHAGYKRDLAELGGMVIDLDVPSALTSDRANFDDPYHVAPPVRRLVVDTLFARGLRP